ncbi:MAG: tRNA-dihydrouridine synthase family protein, partial [Thermodesulfobacteriota bacterium]
VEKWMVGRGALSNPFLAAEIKGVLEPHKLETLQNFHDELFECYRELLSGPAHLLGRMKQFWAYLSEFFPPQQKSWKKIKKCRTESQYQQVMELLFGSDEKTPL